MADVKLKKGAIVIMSSVCTSAGSDAPDTSKTSLDLAISRITSHVSMWFEMGASEYYADSTPDFG